MLHVYSNPLVYLRCKNCGNRWSMTKGKYNTDFLIRKCPKCGTLDTRNHMQIGDEVKLENNGSIILEAIDY